MILHSLKLTGTGAVVALSTGSPALSGYVTGQSLLAKFVQVVTPPGNAARIFVGGNEVTAPTLSPATDGVGFPIPAGWAGQLLPPVAEVTDWYDLSNIFAGMASSDVLYVLYGG